MNEYDSERRLAYLYPLIGALSFICCISTAVAWHHWQYVLDTCVETNCGCILNGLSTPTFFTGGHIAYCHWATYGLVLPIIFCFIFGIFHLFRVCCGRPRGHTSTATVRQRWVCSFGIKTIMLLFNGKQVIYELRKCFRLDWYGRKCEGLAGKGGTCDYNL